ncbi:ATP-dependent DNA helicase RecG [Thalassobaculum litoreum]|uniref:Probable DNA 3'-5' helicase RecG n=1 Tax=Thalassobaculum litoreum DSM 18839 TaxID=1123362 RepID=A0A8G2BE22_9PROT|nr:ATP-dependent DNA helicase RecG [Thalassobaculum litoreum]SDF09363.1 ATP-dependent DNA helicase RecG [Thalassobaculum litoreum DSM 18839]
MRPEILFPLFADVSQLSGIGPRYAKLIEKAAGPQIVDLLWHLPSGMVDRRFSPTVADAPDGMIATLTVTTMRHEPGRGRAPYRVICADETGEIELVYFHAKGDWLEKLLPHGQKRVISGKVERFRGKAQMPHPDHVVPLEEADSVRIVEPTHPSTDGLHQRTIRKAIEGALARVPVLDEWINATLVQARGWPAWGAAVKAVHHPQNRLEMEPDSLPRQRLAYDEILANQLALALVRARMKKQKGRVIKGDGRLRDAILKNLPFSLTGAQRTALSEIEGDMAAPNRMLRLLQGDVGSGKTLVALVTMANAIECGAQAALMAPTEILARQHFATIEPLARAVGIRCEILTGRDKGKTRSTILGRIAEGTAQIVVGTHALFQEEVEFRDLAVAVIDEQHRFGVHQRMVLGQKGQGVDILVMTATPIPRTLVMTAYGDLDVSRLTEKPPGRQPIDTRVVSNDRLMDVIDGIARRMDSGAKVYWVCPLVEESEVLDVAAAEERASTLRERFGDRVGLIHGRMKGPEKDKMMASFKEGSVDLLVATTVIEVGVDVPDATVMVIEHAERFGLAQLHQLRGRIGRGDKASTCLLVYAAPLSETGRARLSVMRDSEDGFGIAEEDLKLRGAGEVLGTRQSGLPTFRMADAAAHNDLFEVARDDARLLLNQDPELEGARGKAVRTLLYLFERDAAVRYLRGA